MGVSRPDILIRKGIYHLDAATAGEHPGNELTEMVKSSGQRCAGHPSGQAVLLSARDLPVRGGCYTERINAPAGAVYPLPGHVDLDQAVVLRPTSSPSQLHDMGFRPGTQSIFVAGGRRGRRRLMNWQRPKASLSSAAPARRPGPRTSRSVGGDHVGD